MTQYQSSSPIGGPAGHVTTQSLVVSRSGLHWPAIISGVFLTLTLFIIAGVLSQAVGLDFTFNSTSSMGAMVGAIIWGGAASLICFGLGAYLAARVARGKIGTGSASLNGFVVWAVTVPILVYVLGSGIGPMLGKKMAALNTAGASQAALMTPANGVNANNPANMPSMTAADQSPGRVGHYQASAWWMLVSLGCGLVGALICGISGTHSASANEEEIRSSTSTSPGGNIHPQGA